MTNKEITEYMPDWVNNASMASSKETKILAFAIAIPVLLAEIAKRLPETP